MSISEMRNTTTGKVVGFLAALALVMSLAFGATFVPAQAQSDDDLQEQINDLLALIAQLQAQLAGTSTDSGDFSYVFTRDLTNGSTGEDVMKLQQYLNRNAATQVAAVGVAGGPGSETSYYGPATAAAVSKYQVANAASILTPLGLTSGTGYFGASTRAHMNAAIAAGDTGTPGTPGTPGDSGDLQGGEADLSFDVEASDENLILGRDNQLAFVLEVEADEDGGDAQISRMDLEFDLNVGASSVYRHIEGVTLEVDGDELAYLRTDRRGDWRGDDNNVLRFSGLDLVVRSGDVEEIDVIVDLSDRTGLSAITLATHEYRYADSTGLVLIDTNTSTEVANVSTAPAFTIEYSENDDTPDNYTLNLNEKAHTGQTLVIVDAEITDGTEGWIDTATVVFSGNLDENIFRSLELYLDGKRVATEDVVTATTNTVTFELDDDFAVEDEDEFEVEVRANFRKVAATTGVQPNVTSIVLIGEDEDGNVINGTSGTANTASYAAQVVAVTGNITVADSNFTRTLPVGSSTTGTVKFDLEITNNSGVALEFANTDFEIVGLTGLTWVSPTTDVAVGNGATVTTSVEFTYTGVAAGGADDISITLENLNDGATPAVEYPVFYSVKGVK